VATAKLSNQAAVAKAKSQTSPELKQRLTFLVLALLVYRLLAHVPVPGVDAVALAASMAGSAAGGLFAMMNLFSGGAMSRASIIALGITPYISASIVVQLATAVVPSLHALQKDGGAGKRKITQYTRYLTLALAIVQSFFIASQIGGAGSTIVANPGNAFIGVAMVSLVTGTMFLMWLGEQITERGLGNGISIIIFAGIVSSLPTGVYSLFSQMASSQLSPLLGLGIILAAIAVVFFVVFVERGQRKIPINYAKRQVGQRMMGGQSSFLPLKVNMSGVIPAIFGSSILLLPATVMNFFSSSNLLWVKDLTAQLTPGRPLYMFLYAVAIIFFAFFYTALVFNSRETADNLKKQGAVVPGIRPGEQTTRYMDKILTRLTLTGALYLTIVCLLPEFFMMALGTGSGLIFGGTSILIIVVVAMDFMAQVQAFMMSQQYESLMKKANFKGSK
jgi:preprotein translocase subunit SecY